MSSETTADQPRSAAPKQTTAPTSAATAPAATVAADKTPASIQPQAPTADGGVVTPAVTSNGTAAGTQGLAAALAQAPDGGPSTDTRKNRDTSNQIDRQIEDESKKSKRECKILLLGKYR